MEKQFDKNRNNFGRVQTWLETAIGNMEDIDDGIENKLKQFYCPRGQNGRYSLNPGKFQSVLNRYNSFDNLKTTRQIGFNAGSFYNSLETLNFARRNAYDSSAKEFTSPTYVDSDSAAEEEIRNYLINKFERENGLDRNENYSSEDAGVVKGEVEGCVDMNIKPMESESEFYDSADDHELLDQRKMEEYKPIMESVTGDITRKKVTTSASDTRIPSPVNNSLHRSGKYLSVLQISLSNIPALFVSTDKPSEYDKTSGTKSSDQTLTLSERETAQKMTTVRSDSTPEDMIKEPFQMEYEKSIGTSTQSETKEFLSQQTWSEFDNQIRTSKSEDKKTQVSGTIPSNFNKEHFHSKLEESVINSVEHQSKEFPPQLSNSYHQYATSGTMDKEISVSDSTPLDCSGELFESKIEQLIDDVVDYGSRQVPIELNDLNHQSSTSETQDKEIPMSYSLPQNHCVELLNSKRKKSVDNIVEHQIKRFPPQLNDSNHHFRTSKTENKEIISDSTPLNHSEELFDSKLKKSVDNTVEYQTKPFSPQLSEWNHGTSGIESKEILMSDSIPLDRSKKLFNSEPEKLTDNLVEQQTKQFTDFNHQVSTSGIKLKVSKTEKPILAKDTSILEDECTNEVLRSELNALYLLARRRLDFHIIELKDSPTQSINHVKACINQPQNFTPIITANQDNDKQLTDASIITKNISNESIRINDSCEATKHESATLTQNVSKISDLSDDSPKTSENCEMPKSSKVYETSDFGEKYEKDVNSDYESKEQSSDEEVFESTENSEMDIDAAEIDDQSGDGNIEEKMTVSGLKTSKSPIFFENQIYQSRKTANLVAYNVKPMYAISANVTNAVLKAEKAPDDSFGTVKTLDHDLTEEIKLENESSSDFAANIQINEKLDSGEPGNYENEYQVSIDKDIEVELSGYTGVENISEQTMDTSSMIGSEENEVYQSVQMTESENKPVIDDQEEDDSFQVRYILLLSPDKLVSTIDNFI